MNTEDFISQEISQRRQIPYDFHLHVESKKQKKNITKQKQSHRHREQTDVCWGEAEETWLK